MEVSCTPHCVGTIGTRLDGEVVHLPKVLQVYMGTDRLTKQDVTL